MIAVKHEHPSISIVSTCHCDGRFRLIVCQLF